MFLDVEAISEVGVFITIKIWNGKSRVRGEQGIGETRKVRKASRGVHPLISVSVAEAEATRGLS